MFMSNLLAALLGILAYSLLNIGFFLQKRAAASLPSIESIDAKANLKNFLTNKQWLVGYLLTVIQTFPFWIALSIGSITVVTPMIGVGLIVFVVISVVIEKEPLSKFEIAGIAFIVVGLVVIGITSEQDSRVWTFQEMVGVFGSPQSIVFLVVSLVAAILTFILPALLKYKLSDVFYGLSSGIFATFGAILSKAFMSAINAEAGGSLQFALSQGLWWLFFILFVISTGGSLIGQQMGYQKGKGVIVVSIFNVMTVLGPSLGGVIMFNEWENVDSNTIIFKVIAYVLLLIGIVVLSIFTEKASAPKPKPTENEAKESDSTPES